MTDLPQHEEIIRRRVRFVVDAPSPWHADLTTMQAAIRYALDDRERRGLGNGFTDALRFAAEDDRIVLYFDVEEPAGSMAPEPFFVEPCRHTGEQKGWLRWPSTNGWLEGPGEDYPVRITADVCDRETCRRRLSQMIKDAVGHVPEYEDYPTR